jgi:hypothetical protein
MKRWLALVALCAVPLTAHAGGEAYKRGAFVVGPSIRSMPAPYAQIKQQALKQGLMKKGSGERMYLNMTRKPSETEAGVIVAKVRGTRKVNGVMKKAVVADAKFKVFSTPDGRVVEGGKFATYFVAGSKKQSN